MSFASVRTDLATALTDNTKWQTFAYPPENPLPNSVIILPGQPWVQPYTVGKKSVLVGYTIKVCVNTADNQGELTKLEDILTDLIDMLPSWAIFKSITAPTELQVGTAYLTVSDLYVEVAVSF